MKKNVLSALLVASLFITLLFGCSKKQDANSGSNGAVKTKDSHTIAVVVKDMSDPWFLRMQKGVEEFAKESGENCFVKGPSITDSAEQIQVIESLIEQNIDALCVVPIDPEACKPALKKAREKGIKVIVHEAAGFDECEYDVEAFNDAEYGEAMMDQLAKAMGEEGQYVTMVAFLVLLICSFSLPVLGNQLLLLSDAVDWFCSPTARRFSKGSNHSLFVTLLIS